MKKNTFLKRLLSLSLCTFMLLSLSAQNNCFQWDYTDEVGTVVTLNGSSSSEIKKMYDNLDETSVTLAVGDVVEFAFPYAMNFTAMLVYSGSETPVNINNLQIDGKNKDGNWEENKTKTFSPGRNNGAGKFYSLANLTTGAGTAGFQSVRFQCVNEPITLSEIQLFGFPNVADGNLAYPKDLIKNNNATITGNAKAQTGNDGLTNLYDRGRATRTVFTGTKPWVECAFTEAKTVKSYLISCASNAMNGNVARQFKDWTLKGSNTEGSEKVWETIDEVKDFLYPKANATDVKFSVANPGSYKYYRLDAKNAGATDETQVSEFQMYDTDIYVPEYSDVKIPTTLYMKGTALAESTDPMVMKRIYRDYPDSYYENKTVTGKDPWVMSNTFELITALQTGEYEFSIDGVGESVISSQPIVVEGEGLVPYRIRVNYDNATTPVVTVSKIEKITLYSPNKDYTVGTFNYIGNSNFKISNITYTVSTWGDPRYRFRVYTEDGSFTSYGYKGADLTPQNDDLTPAGWYDLYPATNNTGFSGNSYAGDSFNSKSYQTTQFKLSAKRRGDTGFTLAPFDMEIKFPATSNYTHVISDYIFNPTSKETIKSEGCTIYPTLIENSVTIVTKEDNFSVEFISVTGISVLKANSTDSTLTLDNINLPKGIYLVKITCADNTVVVQRVIKL